MEQDFKTIVEDMYALVKAGKAIEAIDKYWAEDVVLHEIYSGESIKGFEANKKREEEFFSKVKEVRAMEIKEIVINSATETVIDISFMDITHADMGEMKSTQAAVSKWKNGKIVEITFYPHS